MPSEVIQMRSALKVTEIAQIFQVTLSGRRVEFGKIKTEDDPFATVETQPDFSVVASHDKNIGSWAFSFTSTTKAIHGSRKRISSTTPDSAER